MLLDLHTHTQPLSYDSFLPPDELIERSKQAGLDGIVLSEHDAAWSPDAVKELSKRHNFLVLPGMEINTEEGHMLVYGMHKYVFGMHRVHELAGHVDNVNGLMIQAHPYRRQHPWNWESEKEWIHSLERSEANNALNFVRGLEVLNGRGKLNENQFSKILADHVGMPGTAGTDSHMTDDIGKCVTYFEKDITNEEDLIEALRNGLYWPIDMTKGDVTPDTRYWDVPSDLRQIFEDLNNRQKHSEKSIEEQELLRIQAATKSVELITSLKKGADTTG